MIKHYAKQCKNTRQVNAFLHSLNLEAFEFDPTYTFPTEFDYDNWINNDQTIGVSILITVKLEVLITKYTKKDIDQLEAELLK